MDLDVLKKHWQNEEKLPDEQKSVNELQHLIHKKTQTVIGKLRSSFVFEIYSSVIIMVIFALIAWYTKLWSFKVYFGVFALLIIPFIIIIGILLRKIDELSNTILPVKKNLETVYQIIDTYIKRCMQFTMALIPICLFFSGLLGYMQANVEAVPAFDNMIGMFPSINYFFIAAAVYIIFLTIGIYYFAKWYLKKLYGNYLIELKQLVAELDAN
ncbi:MAG: hypothetical protein ACOVQE_04130 [Chitinophagaceae bacterium]